MSTKLSIIVPVYNGSRRIKYCLERIFQQSYTDLELIVIDDGSADDSWKVVKAMVEKYQGSPIAVKLEKQSNQGVACTRNRGIGMASGDYVAFVDQDDLIDAQYCREYMKEADQTKADIILGGYERVSERGKVKRRVCLKGHPWEQFVVVAPWAHIYRRQFLLQYKIQFLSTGIGEDVYFNFLAYAASRKTVVIDNVDYKWIYNEESVSNSRQNTINEKVDPLYLLDCIHRDIPDPSFLKEEFVEYYFARYICWYLLFSVRGSKKSDIEHMAGALFQWIQEHYPQYRKNRYINFRKPRGEALSISICVWGFYLLKRMKLLAPLLKCLGC